MKYKNKILFLLGASLIVLGVSYLVVYPEFMGLCGVSSGETCIAPYGTSIGEPLFIGVLSIIAVLLVLMFSEKSFRKIKIFSYIYIPISVVIIYLTPVTSSDPFLPLIDREQVTILLSAGYFIISLIIMAVLFVKGRHQ